VGIELLFETTDMIEYLELLTSAKDEIDAINRSNLFGIELSVAACNDDEGFTRRTYRFADHLPAFPVCPFGNAARIDDADVGGLAEFDNRESPIDKLLPEHRGLCKVELAAQGME
jgi:hypothetical protein